MLNESKVEAPTFLFYSLTVSSTILGGTSYILIAITISIPGGLVYLHLFHPRISSRAHVYRFPSSPKPNRRLLDRGISVRTLLQFRSSGSQGRGRPKGVLLCGTPSPGPLYFLAASYIYLMKSMREKSETRETRRRVRRTPRKKATRVEVEKQPGPLNHLQK